MTDGRTRNGGQLLMDSLVALGATRGFGVPGESYLAVRDALVDHATASGFEVNVCMGIMMGLLMGQTVTCICPFPWHGAFWI